MNIIRKVKKLNNFWTFSSIFFIALILTPILAITFNLFAPINETMEHIGRYLLKDYIINSLIIVFATGIITIIFGVTSAWLTTIYEFKGRKFFSFVLILPLTIPSYIMGYSYAGLFSYTGFFTEIYKKYMGDDAYFDILNIYGVIFILSLSFYPYVFIVVKSFLSKQNGSIIEASKSLGKGNFATFIKIIIPISRTAIVAGVTLVIFEVLNSYGVPEYFGVKVFSTGIFSAWLSMGDSDTAVKLSAMLAMFSFSIILIEKYLRKNRSYSYGTTKIKRIKRENLGFFKSLPVILFMGLIFLISFVIPISQLIYWAYLSYGAIPIAELFNTTKNSILITLLSGLIIIIVTLIIANTVRVYKSRFSYVLAKFAGIGYAIPGAVIAIGMMLSFVSLDKFLNPLYQLLGIDKKLVLTLSLTLLISAYVVRFLAVSYGTIESGFEKIGIKFHEASRSMGYGITKTFFKVDLPMIKPAIIGAYLLAFIEIIKELPLTLILRPFNFHTLASLTKQYAEDEMIQEAAIPSLILIMSCIIILLIFNKIMGGKKNG